MLSGKMGRTLGLGALILVLAFLTLYPTLMLVYGSLHTTPPGNPGVFNLDGYRAILNSRNFMILLVSIGISVAKTIPSVMLAILLAWIIARTNTPFAATLEVLITLPFFIPPILTALAWSMLGNKQVGLLNQAWQWASGTKYAPINIYSYGGIIWHLMQYSTVFIFLFIVDAFRAMDPSLEEAARMSGASRWRTVRQITLVLMTPTLLASCMLSLIHGIEAFESPLFFGTPAGITMVTTEIYNSINNRATPNYQYTTALSMGVVILMFALVLLQTRILRGRNFTTVTGKGYRPNVAKLGPWRWVTFSICLIFFGITVVLPVSQLFLSSFFRFFGFYKLSMLTLDNYRAVFNDSDFWRALRNTMLLGLFGASATMILGAMVAYVGVRTKFKSRKLIEILAWLPWMMPGMVMGVGFLWAFAILPQWIPIYGTIWALFLAYIALGTPIATRVMSSAYTQLSFDIEECSRVHGASWWQTLWRILIALVWPAFVVGWILTFFGIMRELSASVLLYSAGTEVFSIVLLKLWTAGKAEEVSVIGLLMMVLVILFRLVQLVFIRRRVSVL